MKCYECDRRIKKKEPFVKRYDVYLRDGCYKNPPRYFHAWCWDMKYNQYNYPFDDLERSQSYLDRRFVKEAPEITKERNYQELKKNWKERNE